MRSAARVGLPPRAVRAGPAERAEPAGTEQLPRLRRVGHHRQVQPEAAADPKRRSQKGMTLLFVGQPVGAHQPHRLLGQHPDAVERAAREQHPREPQIVVDGRPQARAAGAERRIGDRRRTHHVVLQRRCSRRACTSSRRAGVRRCPPRSRCRPCPSGSKMRSARTSASDLPSIRDSAMPSTSVAWL